MNAMKKAILLSAAVACWGCYDLKDGSIAVLFHLGDSEDQNVDTDSGDEWRPDTASIYEGPDTAGSGNVDSETYGDMSSEYGPIDSDTLNETGIWTDYGENCVNVFEMKTGDACDLPDYCGAGAATYGNLSLDCRMATCLDKVVSITETYKFDTTLRTNLLWTDCEAALADAREGEQCEGFFNCFSAADNGCLEQVVCMGAPSSISRKLLCDDVGDLQAFNDIASSGCTDADNARPFDNCTSPFLCIGAREDGMVEIPPCDNQNGFCYLDRILSNENFTYCDGEHIHFYSNLYSGAY